MTASLPAAELRALRAAAHPLKVIVTVGNNGITPALLAELDTALETHELLKVRVNAADRDDRATLVDALCAGSGAALVQRTGFIATLWRARQPQEAKPKPGVQRGRKREERKARALAKPAAPVSKRRPAPRRHE